jgi:hypothetical protein
MEDKTLTTEQSLDLIARMLENTRRNFNDRGGAMFLIWGYTAFFIAPALLLDIDDRNLGWLWFLLPIIGGVLTWLHYRKYRKPVTTYLDRAVSYVWATFAVAGLVCVILDVFLPMRILLTDNSGVVWVTLPTLFIMVLLGSLATATTGLIIRFHPAVIGGLAGMALSFLMIIYKDEPIRYLILPMLLLIVLIIPGHLLNAACKREAAREAQETKNGRAE